MIEIRINFPEKKRNVCWLHVLYHRYYLVTAAIYSSREYRREITRAEKLLASQLFCANYRNAF